MRKLPLLALGILAFGGLLAAAPAPAAGSPPAAPAPFLCPASSSSSIAPAVGVPAPLPMLTLTCGVCSDSLCRGRKVGSACLGPTNGYRCLNNYPVCQDDGLQTCNCDLA